MKRCPKCNRTYADDAFTFCLEDGALLSAPYDPEKKEEPISTIQTGGPPPTAVLPAAPDHEKFSSERPREDELSPLPPTIASPVAQVPQQLVTESPARPTRSRKRSKLIYVIPVVVLLLLVGSGLGLYAYRRSHCWTMTMECKTGNDLYVHHYARCQLYANLWGHHDILPLSNVNWTLSAGKIIETQNSAILIDTNSALGRRIDVKATFSGATLVDPSFPSSLCDTSASASFVAHLSD
jgi:hypothetical protein